MTNFLSLTNRQKISNNVNELTALDTKIGENETNLFNLTSLVGTNETRLLTAEGVGTQNTSDITALDSRVTATETDLVQVNTKLDIIQGQGQGSIQQAIDQAVADHNTQVAQITQIEENATALKGRIDDFNNAIGNEDLQNPISVIEQVNLNKIEAEKLHKSSWFVCEAEGDLLENSTPFSYGGGLFDEQNGSGVFGNYFPDGGKIDRLWIHRISDGTSPLNGLSFKLEVWSPQNELVSSSNPYSIYPSAKNYGFHSGTTQVPAGHTLIIRVSTGDDSGSNTPSGGFNRHRIKYYFKAD